jgi:7-cyano-7-deazaguanine reductase
VAVATIVVPAESPRIVESKSMKLYLGSFAQTRLADAAEVTAAIARDLSAAAGGAVQVALDAPDALAPAPLGGTSLDGLDVACSAYDVDAALLAAGPGRVRETLTTDLFRSLCPVTAQPDIASVRIDYEGPPIDHAGLLRYLVSYRCHAGFHEHCAERIFMDVKRRCARAHALGVRALHAPRRAGHQSVPQRCRRARAGERADRAPVAWPLRPPPSRRCAARS